MITVLSLSGCKIPFTDKEINLPFAEKSSEEVVEKMMDKMQDINTVEYKGKLELTFDLDIGKLEAISKTEDNSMVLGVEEELAVEPRLFSSDDEIIETDLGDLQELMGDDFDTEEYDFSVGDLEVDSAPIPGMPDFSGPMTVTFSYDMTGKINQSDKEKIRTQTDAQISLDMGGMAFNVDLEAVMIEQMLYLKVKQIPFPFSLMLGSTFSNKWWLLDMDELQKKQVEMAKASGEDLMTYSSLTSDPRKMIELEEKINAAIIKHKLMKVEEKLADEKIGDVNTYHFRVSLNEENLDDAASDIYAIILDQLSDDERKAVEEEVDDDVLDIVLNQIQDVITKAEGELWIGKKDFLMYKTKFDIGFDLANINIEDVEIPTDSFSGMISGNFEYFNHNKGVNIEAPSNADSLMDFIDEMVSQQSAYGY